MLRNTGVNEYDAPVCKVFAAEFRAASIETKYITMIGVCECVCVAQRWTIETNGLRLFE